MIPDEYTIIDPLLKEMLGQGGMVTPVDIYEKLASHFRLSPEERIRMYPRSNQNIFENRVRFARQRAIERDLIDGSEYGLWILTEAGRSRAGGAGGGTGRVLVPEYERIMRELSRTLEEEGAFSPESVEDARERTYRDVAVRRGQAKFRRTLLEIYDNRCCVTDCDLPEALEAAHITPYRGSETNHPQNGLLLRADIHTLFDMRLIAVNPENYEIATARRLRDTYYGQYLGQRIALPDDEAHWPSIEALEQHFGELDRS